MSAHAALQLLEQASELVMDAAEQNYWANVETARSLRRQASVLFRRVSMSENLSRLVRDVEVIECELIAERRSSLSRQDGLVSAGS